MTTAKGYDKDLAMFIEEPIPDMCKLEFMRWLAEHGRLEHGIYPIRTFSFEGVPSDEGR